MSKNTTSGSVSYTHLLIPYQITTGGTTGIGAIIYYATGFPIQWSYFIINAVLTVSYTHLDVYKRQEYIFEYIIKKDYSSTFYFEFIAVDNNNQSSEISKLIVNKGIVNYSRELKFSNLKCVSRITGAEINLSLIHI